MNIRENSEDTEKRAIKAFLDIITLGVNSEYSIDDVLQIIGRHFDADRAYIFEAAESGEYITNTYEWCREGVRPEIDNLQEVPIETLEIWYKRYREEGAFYIEINDKLKQDDPLAYEVLAPQNISAMISAPLIAGGNIQGMFGVDNPKANTDHLTLLSVVASTIHRDLQNLRIIRREAEFNRQLKEMNDELEKSADMQNEQLKIVGALSKDYLNVYMIKPEEKKAVILKLDGYITDGLSMDGDKAPEYPYEASCLKYITNRVFQDDIEMMKAVMKLDNVVSRTKDGRDYVGVYRVLDAGNVHYYQYKYVPTGDKGDIIAAFKNVDEMIKSEKLQRKKLQEALDNYKEADYDRRRDFLTGLRNRQDMFEMMQDVLSGKREKIMSAYMMDIDNFKMLNDNYGHVYGDECLKRIGKALNEYAGKNNMVFFRYGGEEMLGIGFGENDDSERIANELVRLIESLDIKRDDLPTGCVTVSLGYTTDNSRYEKMIDKADNALYRAKDMGKNQACCYESYLK